MTSFRSRYYPTSRSPFQILQEHAMRYYAIFSMVVMIGVMVQVYNKNDVLIFGIVGESLAILLGNISAYIRMHRKIGELFFVNDTFTVLSVYDILYKKPKPSFPLKFANPTRNNDTIQFHYTDEIMNIKREDWDEEFELIWNWFQQTGGPQSFVYTFVPQE